MITRERLKKLLVYSARTGLFTWETPTSNRVSKGSIAGVKTCYGYVRISLEGRDYLAHRLVWLYMHGKYPAAQIDHMNGERSDNRIRNLREATASINSQNMRKALPSNKLRILGVSRDCGRYKAQIRINGKQTNLGRFSSSSAASRAYLKAKRKHHEGCTI